MANRIPLVLDAGIAREIASTDTLAVPALSFAGALTGTLSANDLLVTATSGDMKLNTASGGLDFFAGSVGSFPPQAGGIQAFAENWVDIESLGTSGGVFIGVVSPAEGSVFIQSNAGSGINLTAADGPITLGADDPITVTGPSISLPDTTAATLSTARVTVTGSPVPANGMFLPAANTLGFATNTTERIRILSSGRVLINTTTDDFVNRLQVNGSIAASSLTTTGNVNCQNVVATGNLSGVNITASGIVSGVNVTASATVSGAQGSITNNLSAGRVTVTDTIAPANGIYLPAANELAFATNSTHRMRINSSGRLLIGTTSDDGLGLLQVNGDQSFIGASRRIRGDFSDATDNNRTLFQTNVTNGTTALGVIPNGTATASSFRIYSAEDTTNASYGALTVVGGDSVRFTCSRLGSGTFLPFVVQTGGSERLRVDTDGNLLIQTVGTGLRVKEGSNAKMGTATLVAGTVTVNTTAVTANSRIFLTQQTLSGTAGSVYVSARTAGTSFTITSTNAANTAAVAWMIVEPA